MLTHIPEFIRAHKSYAVVAIAVLLALGWYGYSAFFNSSTSIAYTLSNVSTSTVVTSVSESGQVSANTNVTLSPQASGNVVYVGVKEGQSVPAGTLLVKIDSTSADKAVRDASANLTAAQIAYQQAISSSNNSIESARNNGFDTATAVFSDISTITNGLNTILYGTSSGNAGEANVTAYASLVAQYAPNAQTAAAASVASYQAALAAYNQSFALYQTASRTSAPADIEKLLESTNDATTKVNQATKDAVALFNLVQATLTTHNDLTTPPALASQTTTLVSYASKISADNVSALSALTTLQNATVALANDPNGVPLTVQSAELNLTKSKNAMQDARDNLANYYLYAPFDGTVATLSAVVGQSISGSAATMITPQESATLSLSESDVAKVKVGQKAKLTFDAIDNLELGGTVAEVGTVGSVSSGVVSYTVKVSFDKQDSRVKPGMSVTADITTDTATGLSVPSSAVKTSGSMSYVMVFDPPLITTSQTSSSVTSARTPRRVKVTIGLAGDTKTIITSGLKEGEQVVTKSTVVSSSSANSSSSSVTSKASTSSTRELRNISGAGVGGAARPPGM